MPEARYEQREAVELAFIAALQHLPARQRAVLVLRDVLGFSAREVAELLAATVASVNSALQRARRTLEERLPEPSQQRALRRLGDERIRDFVTRFADALERGDVELIVDMLVDDATFAMPPYPAWYRGRRDIAQSWLMPGGPPPRLRVVPARACGQLALGFYRLDQETGNYLPIALDVLTVRGEHISEITAFRTPTYSGISNCRTSFPRSPELASEPPTGARPRARRAQRPLGAPPNAHRRSSRGLGPTWI